MAGIYKLTSPNGKCYIGQSFDLDRRLRGYASGVHAGQRHLHRAVKKYGWKSFKVEILWRTKHPERYRNLNVLLDTLEIAWIKKFDCVANGYNLQYGGSNGLHAEETKQKMSAAHRGKALSAEHRLNLSREVVQYSLAGKKIKTWEAINFAAGGDMAVRCNITRVCRGERRTAGGFQWRYLSDGIEELEPLKNYKKGRNNPEKPVKQLDLAGNLIKKWESINSAAKSLEVHGTAISAVCRGRRRTTGGFKWKYA